MGAKKTRVPRTLTRGQPAEARLALANRLLDIEQAKQQAPLIAAAAQGSATESDASGREKLLRAIPWVVGGLAAAWLLFRSRRSR